MKLQSMKMRTFFMLAALCVAAALLAEHYPGFQVLEYAKWGLVAWLALDVVVTVLPAGWLVRTPTPAPGWASRLFDAPPPERDDRIWSPEQLAAIKASMEAGEPHRFNLIDAPGVRERYPADYIGEFKPRALEELTPIDYHVELPPHPVVDRAVLEPWPPVCVKPPELDPNPHGYAHLCGPACAPTQHYAERVGRYHVAVDAFERLLHDYAHAAAYNRKPMPPRPVRPDRRDFGLAPYNDDPPPKTGHDSEILATTTLPTGSDFTQEAHSSDVSGDSQLLDSQPGEELGDRAPANPVDPLEFQLLDKDRDEWGDEVHGAVKGLIESDGVALTPHEEADLRKRVHAFMAEPVGDPLGFEGAEGLRAYYDTITIDQHRTGRPGQRGRAEGIRNSTFGRDMEARAFAALAGIPDAGIDGDTPVTVAGGTAAALIREVAAKHGPQPITGPLSESEVALEVVNGTLRQTDPDGTVTETTIPLSDKGEVHMLDVDAAADGTPRRFIHPTSGDPYGPRIRLDTMMGPVRPQFDPILMGMDFGAPDTVPVSITVGIDTVLPPVEYGKEALADLRSHGVAYHRVALDDAGALRFEHVLVEEVLRDQTITEDSMSWKPLELRPENVGRYFGTEACDFGVIAVDPNPMLAGDTRGVVPALVMGPERLEVHVGPLQWGGDDELERLMGEASGGMVVSGPPPDPIIAKVEYDQRALRLLRPDPVGDSRAKHRSRYWEDRYDAMNPDITEAELQRRMLDRPTDAASVRKAVAAVTEEVRGYTPPSLQLAGPEAIPQLGGALIPVGEVQHLAMVRVADVGALAVSLAVDNDHLRNELNASMAMRQEAARTLAAFDLDDDGTHALDKLEPGLEAGTMSKADAKALMIRMGWLIQQETVAVWVDASDDY